jgi:hypothetical protein
MSNGWPTSFYMRDPYYIAPTRRDKQLSTFCCRLVLGNTASGLQDGAKWTTISGAGRKKETHHATDKRPGAWPSRCHDLDPMRGDRRHGPVRAGIGERSSHAAA